MPHPWFPSPRAARGGGSAILLVVVLIVVLTLVGLAVVTRASSEQEAVGAKHRYDKELSCTDAARDLLISQFRTYGLTPSDITLNTVVDDKRMGSGHYDSIAVKSVVASAGAAAQGAIGASDISNRISRTRLGGVVYRMTVVCGGMNSDGGISGQQNEVEYMVRFGL